ncbi:MAG: DNRLRE domain-containing protein, partial [Hadesarchaea archaeon]|nr:DNRLRE domain-containing protein [Hadesarchaea archaeon]
MGSRHRLLEDQRGVTAIIGFVLVIGLVVMAMGAYLAQQVPEDWREAEWDTMQEVKSSFLELRSEIHSLDLGEVATVKVRMGTPAPTAMRSATTNATLKVVTAKDVGDVEEAETDNNAFQRWRGYGTYVREAQPTANYTSSDYDNDHLLVSTTQNQRVRTYLKFDLSESYLYDRGEYVFHDDAQVEKAELLLYCTDADLEEDPDNVMDIRVPMVVEVWGVENDAWDESLDWDPQPHDTARDVKLENTDIDGEDEWVAWDVTTYVKREFEKYRGWGKWYQTQWWTLDAALESGKFSSSYSKYNGNTGAGTGYTLTGPGTVTSMAFDAGDNNAFWNYVGFRYSGSPTVDVRFDNNIATLTTRTWINVPHSGYKENVYARYAQYRVNLANGDSMYNITLEYTCHVSFVLREPEAWAGGSSLRNRATFNSTDNSQAAAFDFDPRLRITYTRRERLGYPSEGLIDFGSIKYEANNEYFPGQYYTYEGGMVYIERD